MTAIITKTIAELILIIFGALANFCLVKIFNLLKISKQNKYLQFFYDALENSINATNQMYVENLKKDGRKLTEEEKKIAFEMTKENLLNSLNSKAQTFLNNNYNDFEKFLETNIEATIAKMRKN